MSMALRNLATRMRSPAAAVLRPRVSPPPLRFRLFSSLEESDLLQYICHVVIPRHDMIEDDVQQHEDRESAIRLYQENLATLDRVKKHQEFMRARVGFLEKGNKCLSWSLLLMPILTVAVILKAIAG